MAVYLDQCNSEISFGDLIAAASLYPGDVVVPDYSAGTAAAPASDAAGDVRGLCLVLNYDSYADTDMTNSSDYYVASGEYVRLKALAPGDVITTDRFIGTYADIAVDDIFTVNGTAGSGTIGKWIAIGERTSILRAVVIEKTTIYGNNALKLRVISA